MSSATSAARPTVSVVVPTCGNAVELRRALTSIFAARHEPLEVVVVENRPPAPHTRRLVETGFPGRQLRYVEELRHGLSFARNAGLACTEGQVVAFTDDDVIVDKDWIRNGLDAISRHHDVACVTGRILPMSLDTPTRRLFADLSVFDKGSQLRVFRLPDTRTELPLFPYVAGHVGSGANLFMLREVAGSIGGFDHALGTGTPAVGGEDLDLFIRLVLSGFSILYDPSVIVFHDHPDSVRELRSHAYRYGMGFTAMLTKHLIHGPRRLELLHAIPEGTRYLLDPHSRKNVQRAGDYPRSLEALEYAGMLLGPFAYATSVAVTTTRGRLRISARGPHLADRRARVGT